MCHKYILKQSCNQLMENKLIISSYYLFNLWKIFITYCEICEIKATPHCEINQADQSL